MQDDISTTTGGRTETKKGKKSNGKWASKEQASVDDAMDSSSTVQGASKNLSVEHAMESARSAYDTVVSRGSDILSKVDLSRGTTFIRSYPVQAAVGGLIVGFLLGALISRRQV
ncbi:MAG: hypothetical protein HC883_02170 [Bdellovibrionaceae bacterium]|nr:hypothetical protein [Pseudobdellovibrionaceae bacterium]